MTFKKIECGAGRISQITLTDGGKDIHGEIVMQIHYRVKEGWLELPPDPIPEWVGEADEAELRPRKKFMDTVAPENILTIRKEDIVKALGIGSHQGMGIDIEEDLEANKISLKVVSPSSTFEQRRKMAYVLASKVPAILQGRGHLDLIPQEKDFAAFFHEGPSWRNPLQKNDGGLVATERNEGSYTGR